jgi:hypothetical protein
MRLRIRDLSLSRWILEKKRKKRRKRGAKCKDEDVDLLSRACKAPEKKWMKKKRNKEDEMKKGEIFNKESQF